MSQKIKIIAKGTDSNGNLTCTYEASFWEGPTRAGDSGKRITTTVKDVRINGRWLNTASNVSYYDQLPK